MLDVHLLGQARVDVNGETIRFAKRSVTLAMLAYLVLHSGKPVARQFLAFTLFPELDEDTSLKELRRYLYLAQKALPPSQIPWILADGDTVLWNAEAPARIDVRDFESQVKEKSTMGAAVELYDGDLLPEIYDDWVIAERERLRALYISALTELVMQSRSDRDSAAAIGYARRLLNNDPWREDVVRQLLAAHYERGDVAGALAEYDRFAHSARKELLVEPMPETRALRDAIASGAPLPSSLDRRFEQQRRPPDGLPFCGRARDMERLLHAWERAVRGTGGVVTLEGEPGIGKSRLAAEFALIIEGEGGRVLAGSTSFPETVPYQCVVDALRGALPLIGALPNDPLRNAILAQVLAELRIEEPSLPNAPPVEPEREQARLFDAIGNTIAAFAQTRPLLVLVEDVHWCGNATLELLRSLALRTANRTMLIVMTFRAEEAQPDHPLRALQRDLVEQRLAIRVPLARLTRDDVADVVGRLSGARAKHLDIDALFTHSEGSPLFLHEAIHESLDGRSLEITRGGIADVVARRLERLSPEAKRLAYAAAVCGNAFDADVACNASGASDTEALSAVEELIDRHIVREAGTAGGFEYAFTHHLITAALYSMMDSKEKSRRHARVARALERIYHGRLDRVASEIGRHYAEAGERSRAAGWYARAARNASAIFAHDDVARYATLALDGTDDRAESFEMLLTREKANARLGRRNEQAADLDQLEALCRDGNDRCEILYRRIDVLRALEDREAERHAIAELRLEAQHIGDRHWQGVADSAAAWLEISIGRYADAKPLALAAFDHLEGFGSAAERADCLSALAEIFVSIGEKAAAEEALGQARTIAREAEDARALVGVLMQTVAVAMSQQQFERVAEFGAQAVALYRSQGDRLGEARALVNLAAASVRLSRWEAARDANLIAARTFELAGDLRGLARVLMNLGMLHGRCGDLDEGRRLVARAREHQIRLGDERALTASFLNESFLALWQGDARGAKTLAVQALEIAERMQHAGYRAQALGNLGAAERDLGELDAAIAHMDEGLSMQLRLGRLPDAISDLADAALANGMRGRLDAALPLVERILSIDRAWTDAAIFPPYPPWVAARILHAAGDPRAPNVLKWASKLAVSFAASIDLPDMRARFEALPFVEEIRRAISHDTWPPLGRARRTSRARPTVTVNE
ncbi:MAG: AAA family ATPase [Candidatus Eremiobacteraeota bacterium]|nr:AAA family ATPase [Candidatus Eremiobacteraeota bacterium]